MKNLPFIRDVWAALGFLLSIAVLAFATWMVVKVYRNTPAEVDFDRYPVKGIDVSAHNGPIDFKQVKSAGYDFVWIKASEGETFRDTLFTRNFDAAGAAGMRTGAYHYFRFDCDGMRQAMNLVQSLEGRIPDLGVAIDIEDEGNVSGIPARSISARLSAMLDYLNLRGYPITLYSNKDGYYSYLQEEFSDYPLWICSFTDGSPIDDAPQWTFWQYSHRGTVPGIRGRVDENVMR